MSLRGQVVGRLIQKGIGRRLALPPELSFPEIVMASTEQVVIPTEAGAVRCTLYRPTTVDGSRDAAPPLYVNVHGGGYVIRHPEQDDALCRYLAHHAGALVLNVDYDVAPQRPFPAAVLQVHGVCAWTVADGESRGWDRRRVAVGGQSAGGALAAAACRIGRDRGTFRPRLQVLLYPPLDLSLDPAQKVSLAEKPLIDPRIARVFDEAYLPTMAAAIDPLVSPAAVGNLADLTSLTGLPPAVVLTAELDSLRAEGDRYADALDAAGVPVTHRVVPGVDHGFTHAGPVPAALETYAFVASELTRALGVPVPGAR